MGFEVTEFGKVGDKCDSKLRQYLQVLKTEKELEEMLETIVENVGWTSQKCKGYLLPFLSLKSNL